MSEFDSGFSREMAIRDGRRVRIVMAEDGEKILFLNEVQQLIGRFELRLYDYPNYFYLKWMYLDLVDESYLGQGLGRFGLLFHKEIFDLPILAAPHDGIVRDDGSHLTGDAPGFVAKMREEGVIERNRCEGCEYEEL